MEQSATILIADDNTDTVELLSKRFRAEGYRVTAAHDGEEALNSVRDKVPDLIVLDIMMPKIDGLEVCRQLKGDETLRHIPILMLTAKSEIPDKVKGLDTGADGYLTKPFAYTELSAMIRSLLAQRDASVQQAQKEKLAALDQVVDEVSHEVRNPLVAIGGLSRRIMKNLPEKDPNRKYLDIILQNVTSLEKMLDQLVTLKSTTMSRPEMADINKVIMQAIQTCKGSMQKKGIQLTTALPGDLPPVPVDANNLATALGNIIENSIEAMESSPEKKLLITTGIDKDCLRIEVTDTGRGISREDMKNIFDPFFTSKIYGPGLGLTFALKTIQSHNGTLTVQSEIGQKTCFTIKLPLQAEPAVSS